jgi:hypothetical protein
MKFKSLTLQLVEIRKRIVLLLFSKVFLLDLNSSDIIIQLVVCIE